MKSKWLKISSVVLLLAMVMVIFTGWGEKAPVEPETTEPTTEAKPQVLVLDSVTYNMLGSDKTFTVGKQLELDGSGRIASLKKTYDSISFQYNDVGAIVRADITDDKGEMGYETWTYVDGIPTERISDPNDGFHVKHERTITSKVDENGRIIELVEDDLQTDPEDGSKEREEIRYEYDYDADGRVSAIRYYDDNELDHTTKLTYDDNGNILVYSNVDDDNSEYLRFEFTYKSVDADTVTTDNADNFTKVLNWEYLINHVL